MQKGFSGRPPVRDAQVSRRKFLTWGVGAIAGFIGVALGVPLAGYAVSPALAKKEKNWVEVGPIGEFTPLTPAKVEYDVFRRDGWVEEQVRKSAWVVAAQGGQDFVVYDPRCTHLGCAYRWESGDKMFLCPCHDAKFDLDGKVVAGPPPRPLDRLESKVEGGKLFIMEG